MFATLQRATAALCISGALFGVVADRPAEAAARNAASPRAGALSPYVDQETCREMRKDSEAFDDDARAHLFDKKEELDAEALEAMSDIHKKGNNNGSAAPNAAAQAMLGMLAGQMASRKDKNSQVALEWYKSMGITPGSSDAGLGAIGCGTR